MSIGAPQYKDSRTKTDMDATLTLVANDAYHQNLDANGSGRNVVLPAGDGTQGGRCMVTNLGGEALTVQQSDASTTVLVIDANEAAEVVCNGQSTTTGWQAVGITES